MRIVFGLLIIVIVSVVYVYTRTPSVQVLPSPYISPTHQTQRVQSPLDQTPDEYSVEMQFSDKEFRIIAVEVSDDDGLSLTANFNANASGEALVKEHGCVVAVNGGFYREDGKPLGLFFSEGSQAGALIQSNLVTGFFWESKDGKRHISRDAPAIEEADYIIQTGPLMPVGIKKLQLVQDEHARRSLLGLSSDGTLHMITVFEKDNTFGGPLLADVPRIFNESVVQEKWQLTTLLNLDGGSASFFYLNDGTETFMLSELKPIGSLLCVNDAG